MDSRQIIETLRQHEDELHRQGVAHIALFGSAARGDARPDSDIDILVAFQGPATYDRYVGLQERLEDLLGRRVDLVTERGLKPRARRAVEVQTRAALHAALAARHHHAAGGHWRRQLGRRRIRSDDWSPLREEHVEHAGHSPARRARPLARQPAGG